jgi:hypothetical protein
MINVGIILKTMAVVCSFTPIGSSCPGFNEIYGNFKTASGNERQRSATRIQQHLVAADGRNKYRFYSLSPEAYAEPKDSVGAL